MSPSDAIPVITAPPRRDWDPQPGEVRCFLQEPLPRVVMRGEIDMTTEPQLSAAYRELALLPPTDIVLDLGEVTFFGCVALRLVVQLTARLTPTDHKLLIPSPSRPARRLLELAGFV
ncbi:STAS domain-containing protein [Nocardia sp. NPDC004068]|uniref:STAS domain-containing protein n=1 Tax=Nocardia sp. NPDC004068 TaxID=3364303 RepID=UPI0036BA0BFA